MRPRHGARTDQQELGGCPCGPAARRTAGCRRPSSTSSPDGNRQGRQVPRHCRRTASTTPLIVGWPCAALPGTIVADLDQRAQPVDPGGPVQHRVRAAVQKHVLDLGARQPVPASSAASSPSRSEAPRRPCRTISVTARPLPWQEALRRPAVGPAFPAFELMRVPAPAAGGGTFSALSSAKSRRRAGGRNPPRPRIDARVGLRAAQGGPRHIRGRTRPGNPAWSGLPS